MRTRNHALVQSPSAFYQSLHHVHGWRIFSNHRFAHIWDPHVLISSSFWMLVHYHQGMCNQRKCKSVNTRLSWCFHICPALWREGPYKCINRSLDTTMLHRPSVWACNLTMMCGITLAQVTMSCWLVHQRSTLWWSCPRAFCNSYPRMV